LLGGFIGWALAGPLGGIVGSIIGGTVGRGIGVPGGMGGRPGAAGPDMAGRGDGASAAIALVVLMAAVTRADSRVSKGEVSYVKEFLIRTFGRDNAADLMKVYKQALEKNLDLDPICSQVRAALPPEALSQLIHTLIGLVQADDEAQPAEIELVREIAGRLGLSAEELGRIEAMYWSDPSNAYRVLGAKSTDSMDVIKSKYRELVKKYHPDRVAGLGEEFKELANTKFRQVQEAYETIEKSRRAH
jgi:DnaJ like chaperone protein